MTPLQNHFSKFICDTLKDELNITTIEQAARFTDEALLRVRGFGKIALKKLREIQQTVWIETNSIKMLSSALLPCEVQIDEKCTVNFGRTVLNGRVTAVTFVNGKYFYDVQVEFYWEDKGVGHTRLHRLEAYLVKKNNN